MQSSGEDSSSSFARTHTSIIDYDSIPQFELPFGEKIPVTGDAYSQDNYIETTAQVRGNPMAGSVAFSPSQTIVEDGEEDVQVSEPTFSDDEESELSPLQYARLNGLTTDYVDHQPLQSALIPSPPASVLMDTDPIEHRADSINQQRKLTQKWSDERWDLDQETAELLTSVMTLGRINELDDEFNVTRMRDLKIEEPVLSLDPECELSRLRARNAVRISAQGMKPYILDTRKGENLLWSAEDLKLPSTIGESIVNEKLDVDQETMELLREVIKPSAIDHWEAVEQAIEADQSCRLRRETTPLLPLSPPLSPYEAFNETHEMVLTSTPENLFAHEAALVEGQLFERDDASHQLGTSSRTFGGQNTSDDIQNLTKTPTTSSSSPLRQKRLRYLKADTPLLHEEPETSPAKRLKTVSFRDELHTMIPAPDSDGSIMNPALARQDIDGFVAEVVAPLAQPVIDQVDNEKLDELDTTLRLIVPAVEIVQPNPPWKSPDEDGTRGSNDDNTAVLSRIEKEIPNDQKKWSGLSKLEQLLSWTPFPRYLGNISIDEQFDDGSCERYMAELTLDDDSSDVDALLWKPEGLRLLDPHDSDDDELETAEVHVDEDIVIEEEILERPPATLPSAAPKHYQVNQFPTMKPELGRVNMLDRRPSTKPERGQMGMQALLQRRKLELETASKPKRRSSAGAAPTTRRPDNGPPDDEMLSTSNFARSDLRSFLGLQGVQMLGKDRPRVHLQDEPPTASRTAAFMLTPEPVLTGPPRTLPSPMLLEPERAMSVVISSSILARRQLVREVQGQLPNLELIERDSVDSTSKSQTTCEADFSLSPSTGLICTTLQKLKQKPLPGQRDFFGIRARIALVTPQYERCIVLVSEGRQDNTVAAGTLVDRDTTAISELVGFARTLESSVEACYVAGGEGELARWIAATICRCSDAGDDTMMIHDDTMWERVLRIAGTNPAAAQNILASLERPESSEASESSSNYCGSDGSPYGLSAFVQMSAEERIQRFGPLLGGEKALRRVSEVVDGYWMSASAQ